MFDTIEMPIVPDYTSRVSQLQAGNIYYSVNTRTTLNAEDTLQCHKVESRVCSSTSRVTARRRAMP